MIQLDGEALLISNGIKAEKNYASLIAGVIQILTYSSMEMYDSYLNENYADQASCLNIL